MSDTLGPPAYDGSTAQYQVAVIEQHKIYVEMADRISARRSVTNTYFLTLRACPELRLR